MPECKFGMNDKLIMSFAQREKTYVWAVFKVFQCFLLVLVLDTYYVDPFCIIL